MLPFISVPKESFIKVGSADSGELYLKSIKARKASERKVLDIVDRIESQGQLFLLEFSQKVALSENIELDEAFTKIVSGDSRIAINYSSDYKKLSQLNSQKTRLKDMIPTIVIKERILYPVKLAKAAKPGDKTILLESLSTRLPIRSQLKFNSVMVEIISEADPLYSQIELNCEPVSAALKADSIGFICDAHGKAKVGKEDFDEIPEIILGLLTDIGNTEAEFLDKIRSLPTDYRELCLESLSDIGFTNDIIQDILLRFKTCNVRDLSEDLIEDITNFYAKESRGESEETEKKA